jgi:hypothetical protein
MPQKCPTVYAEHLERPITHGDILTALRAGVRHKAPWDDDLVLEFNTENMNTIKADLRDLLNQTFINKQGSPGRNTGLCYAFLNPMTPIRRTTTAPYLFSLLSINSPELRHRRLRPIMEDHFRRGQFCAVTGNSTMDAVAKVGDAITYSETTGTPLSSPWTLRVHSTEYRTDMFDILRRCHQSMVP